MAEKRTGGIDNGAELIFWSFVRPAGFSSLRMTHTVHTPDTTCHLPPLPFIPFINSLISDPDPFSTSAATNYIHSFFQVLMRDDEFG